MTIVEITPNSLYCPYCDTVVETTICVPCNEYKLLTITEAVLDGFIEAL